MTPSVVILRGTPLTQLRLTTEKRSEVENKILSLIRPLYFFASYHLPALVTIKGEPSISTYPTLPAHYRANPCTHPLRQVAIV